MNPFYSYNSLAKAMSELRQIAVPVPFVAFLDQLKERVASIFPPLIVMMS
jgi:hypothetical protein